MSSAWLGTGGEGGMGEGTVHERLCAQKSDSGSAEFPRAPDGANRSPLGTGGSDSGHPNGGWRARPAAAIAGGMVLGGAMGAATVTPRGKRSKSAKRRSSRRSSSRRSSSVAHGKSACDTNGGISKSTAWENAIGGVRSAQDGDDGTGTGGESDGSPRPSSRRSAPPRAAQHLSPSK